MYPHGPPRPPPRAACRSCPRAAMADVGITAENGASARGPFREKVHGMKR